MSKETAGEGMASRSAVVIRGMRSPFFGLSPEASTSSKAELCGVAVPMPTFYARSMPTDRATTTSVCQSVFIGTDCFDFRQRYKKGADARKWE